MKIPRKVCFLFLLVNVLAGCSEKWSCQIQNRTMFSISESGELGGARKGCSCDQIRAFELKEFGRVDEQALKDDFGC
jgi:hypothetical protein